MAVTPFVLFVLFMFYQCSYKKQGGKHLILEKGCDFWILESYLLAVENLNKASGPRVMQDLQHIHHFAGAFCQIIWWAHN